MTKIKFLFLVLFLLSFKDSFAQETKYKAKPEVLYGFYMGNRPLPLTMTSPMGKVDIARLKRKDRKEFRDFGDWLLGLNCYLRHPNCPIGGFFTVGYQYRNFKMQYPGESEYKVHKMHIVTPAVGLFCRIGKKESIVKLHLEAAIAYNYNWKYKGSYENNLNVVNNGFSGVYGIGVAVTPSAKQTYTRGYTSRDADGAVGMLLVLGYRHDYFNCFNNNFTFDGVTPYKGFKNFFGYPTISLSVGIMSKRYR
jgi:hypothetical protein